MKTQALLLLTLITSSSLAFGEIKGIFTRAQITTPAIAVSLGRQDGLTETEARIKARGLAETMSYLMSSYDRSDIENDSFSEMLKAVGEPCRYSNKLQMEGEKITYDLYTSLVDGNTYVRAVLTFKYKCPELSRP